MGNKFFSIMQFVRLLDFYRMGIEDAIYMKFILGGHKIRFCQGNIRYGLAFHFHKRFLPAKTNILRFLYYAIVELLEADGFEHIFDTNIIGYLHVDNIIPEFSGVGSYGKIIDVIHHMIKTLDAECNKQKLSMEQLLLGSLRRRTLTIDIYYNDASYIYGNFPIQGDLEYVLDKAINKEKYKCTIL